MCAAPRGAFRPAAAPVRPAAAPVRPAEEFQSAAVYPPVSVYLSAMPTRAPVQQALRQRGRAWAWALALARACAVSAQASAAAWELPLSGFRESREPPDVRGAPR